MFSKKPRGEEGFSRNPLVLDAVLIFVLALCVWASFSTGATNNKLEKTQDELTTTQAELKSTQTNIETLSVCNARYLTETLKSLNDRTDSVQDRANWNVRLQKKQSEFIRVLLTEPPVPPSVSRDSLEDYFETLTKFVNASNRASSKFDESPYPTDQDLRDCLTPELEEALENYNAVE